MATFHELDQLLEATRGRLSLVTVFTIPPGVPAGWEKGDLLSRASAFADCQVILDKGGVEAGRYHVKGSGHALLYSPSGVLLFSGGITAARGHEGDNLGLSAIIDLVQTGHAAIAHTPVFGCSLL